MLPAKFDVKFVRSAIVNSSSLTPFPAVTTQRSAVMGNLSSESRDELPAEDFAEPAKRAYPIEDKSHAANAKARATQAVKAGRISKAGAGRIDKKADAVLKKK